MARRDPKREKSDAENDPSRVKDPIAGLRIIGGSMRGRKIEYSGDLRTRPMKDRLREAIFNLIGPAIRGKLAIDLFAGTGALGLEAVSRGAGRALLVEQHFPTANLIRQNIAALGISPQAEVTAGNTFIWWKMKKATVPTDRPWTVFCSPPYEFYISRADEMLELISGILDSAPPESEFVVEADARFDFQTLPDPSRWDVREYSPAVVGIYRKP
jgi:16S rRNA (guanine966-N2)-methyltransferase